MRRLISFTIRSFLQGLLIISPMVLTGYIIYVVFDSVDSLLPFMPVRGLGFLIIITAITLTGYLGTRFFLGRMLINGFDYLMEHMPGVKYLYTSLKDIMDSFVGDKKRFNEPVWVRTNDNPQVWRIGFLTQKDLSRAGMKGCVAVYLPHSYAISGYVIVVDAGNVKRVEGMNAAEAMKFAVSGGVTSQEEDTREKAKKTGS